MVSRRSVRNPAAGGSVGPPDAHHGASALVQTLGLNDAGGRPWRWEGAGFAAPWTPGG